MNIPIGNSPNGKLLSEKETEDACLTFPKIYIYS